MTEKINTIARLKVSTKLEFVDLYLPQEVWGQLVRKLNGNKLTVALRFEGEDGTTILESG